MHHAPAASEDLKPLGRKDGTCSIGISACIMLQRPRKLRAASKSKRQLLGQLSLLHQAQAASEDPELQERATPSRKKEQAAAALSALAYLDPAAGHGRA